MRTRLAPLIKIKEEPNDDGYSYLNSENEENNNLNNNNNNSVRNFYGNLRSDYLQQIGDLNNNNQEDFEDSKCM